MGRLLTLKLIKGEWEVQREKDLEGKIQRVRGSHSWENKIRYTLYEFAYGCQD